MNTLYELAALEQQAQEIEEHTLTEQDFKKIDQVFGSISVLEQIKSSMTADMLDKGYTSKQSLKVIGLTVQEIGNTLNMDDAPYIPTLENYNDPSDRVAISAVAQEGVGDAIRWAWKKLREYVMSIFRAFVSVFKRSASDNKALVKDLDEIIKTDLSTIEQTVTPELDSYFEATLFSKSTHAKPLVEITVILDLYAELFKNVDGFINIAKIPGDPRKDIINFLTSIKMTESAVENGVVDGHPPSDGVSYGTSVIYNNKQLVVMVSSGRSTNEPDFVMASEYRKVLMEGSLTMDDPRVILFRAKFLKEALENIERTVVRVTPMRDDMLNTIDDMESKSDADIVQYRAKLNSILKLINLLTVTIPKDIQRLSTDYINLANRVIEYQSK